MRKPLIRNYSDLYDNYASNQGKTCPIHSVDATDWVFSCQIQYGPLNPLHGQCIYVLKCNSSYQLIHAIEINESVSQK